MTDSSSFATIHRELFVWLAHRSDARGVDYGMSELVFAPNKRMKEDGSAWPALVRVKIELEQLSTAWTALEAGARTLAFDRHTDIPEIAAFSLLDVHLDEAINSLREPGPNGYRYLDASFRAF